MAREIENDKTGNESLLNRRSYLRMTGSAVAATGLLGASSVTSAKQYDTVTVPAGQTKSIEVGDGETFENKLIDVTASGAGVAFTTSGNDWKIRNVGVKGEGSGESFVIMPGVESSDGHAVIENVYLGDGNKPRQSGGGVWVNANMPHNGVIDFKRVHIAHFPNNGLYASGPATKGGHGIVNVYDSYFHSNNISNIRTTGKGSRTPVVKNSVVHVDSSTPACGENCSSPGAVSNRGIYAWYDTTKVVDSDIQGGFTTTHGGEVKTVNTRTGQKANTKPPKGAPMSAEEAANGQKR